MRTTFSFGGAEYEVSGWLWGSESGDGADDAIIVERVDGTPIPGAEMHPGMIQTGVPERLYAAAERALRREWGDPAKRRKGIRAAMWER